jgi:hypothetical protein
MGHREPMTTIALAYILFRFFEKLQSFIKLARLIEKQRQVQKQKQMDGYSQANDGLNKLLKFTQDTLLPEVQMNAAKTIARAAKSFENRKILHKQVSRGPKPKPLSSGASGYRCHYCLLQSI